MGHYNQWVRYKELSPLRRKGQRRNPPKGWGSGTLRKSGYRFIYKNVNGRRKQVAEHREIMAQYLGRDLLSDEEVHHKNGVKHDNRLENLEIWNTSHPAGQRIPDKIVWAEEMLRRYAPDRLLQ